MGVGVGTIRGDRFIVCPAPDARERWIKYILAEMSNGAVQLGIEDRKGSIEAGKDADFLVFDKDLLTAEHEGFSYNMPAEVYFEGKKIN